MQGDVDAIEMLTDFYYRQAAYWGRKGDASRSEIHSTRDAAKQLLQQIREEQNKRAQHPNQSIA